MRHRCLSIAGFDGSGGAGIQADLKTFSALGCYGMTVLTAIPVQNTCGVRSCYDIPLQCIDEQLHAIFDDIIPDSIKVGMLFSSEIIEGVANFLSVNAHNIPIVVDPVMVAKSGDVLLKQDAIHTLKTKLLPMATIVTPNLLEAQAMVGDIKGFEKLSLDLLKLGSKAVLLKGGHSGGSDSDDLFVDKEDARHWLCSKRINSNNTHGTGCTLSSAICAYLARGCSLLDACERAKVYLSQAILASKDDPVGKGHGPVNHFYNLWPTISNAIGDEAV